MRCPAQNEVWLQESADRDPRWTEHLDVCAHCRAEADAAARLRTHLQRLPALTVPAGVSASFRRLAETTAREDISCADVRDALEAWREGTLVGAQAFLVEDHLLWCGACAQELARAEFLTASLRTLPALEVPAAVAERVAAARVPWWQRFFPAPAPSWRGVGVVMGAMAASLALVFMSFSTVFHAPQVARMSVPTHVTTLDAPPTPTAMPASRPLRVAHRLPTGGDAALIGWAPGATDAARQAWLKQVTLNGAAHPGNATTVKIPAPKVAPVSDAPLLAYHPERKTEFAPAPHSERADDHAAYEPAVVASAREAMLRRAREDDLATSEDAASTLPDNALVASSVVPHRTVRKPAAAPAPVDGVNQAIRDGMTRVTPAAPQPITVSTPHAKPAIGLVLYGQK